jgi:hypothetical protein
MTAVTGPAVSYTFTSYTAIDTCISLETVFEQNQRIQVVKDAENVHNTAHCTTNGPVASDTLTVCNTVASVHHIVFCTVTWCNCLTLEISRCVCTSPYLLYMLHKLL